MEYTSVINSRGVAVKDYDTALKEAGFDWDVLEDKVQGVTCGAIMPRKKMLYRSDNNTALGVVGEDYCPSKPRQFLETQFTLASELGGSVVRAGWTERRSKAFSIIRLTKDLKLPKGDRKRGDIIGCYIYTTDGWDGGTPRMSKLYLERLVCTNGMSTQELSADLWVPHTQGLEDRFSIAWKQFQTEVDKVVSDMRDKFVLLANARMGVDEAKEFFLKLVPGDGEVATEKRAKFLDLFEHGIGLQGKSRWDALNAVTEYVTHHVEYRESKIASAATSRFLGVVGGRNHMSERALTLLLP